MTARAHPIELVGVTKTYPSRSPAPPVHALRGIDLEIGDGEVVAVMGPSGSGKSTLLNVLGLLDRPTTGTYRLAGTEVAELSERRRTRLRAAHLGFVFQAFHLINHADLIGNVELPLVHLGYPPRARRELAVTALTSMGLAHRMTAQPLMLSGGERQRAAIARAIVHRPSVVLCDEPTGNLDTENGDIVLDLLTGLADQHCSVVIVTHDPTVAARAHRTITVIDGRVA